MDAVQSQSVARKEEKDKMALYYQGELQQWIGRLGKEQLVSQRKRDALSAHCLELQECLKGRWSTTSKKLSEEKDKYSKLIIRLLPEWQKTLERQQMHEISAYESKVSLIQQRRHTADIAFEKEKKLLSILSIRKHEIEKLQHEEKQEALIRNHQRQSISLQERDIEDQARATRHDSFADLRLQEYIIRKEVTSELERKFSAQIDDIKSKFLRDTNTEAEVDRKETQDTSKSSVSYIEPQVQEEYRFEHHQHAKPQQRPASHRQNQNSNRARSLRKSKAIQEEASEQAHDEEEKAEMVFRSTRRKQSPKRVSANVGEQDGTEEFMVHNDRVSSIPMRIQDDKVSNAQIGHGRLSTSMLSVQNGTDADEAVDSTSLSDEEELAPDSLDTEELESKLNGKSAADEPGSPPSAEQEDKGEDTQDTQQIERAIGMIEVNYGAQSRQNSAKPEAQPPLKISITSEKQQRTLYKSPSQKKLEDERVVAAKEQAPLRKQPPPKQKPPQKSKNLKLKRSFRARTSKNRLQFSLLASPNKQEEDISDKQTSGLGQSDSLSLPKPRFSDVEFLVIFILIAWSICHTEKDQITQRFRG